MNILVTGSNGQLGRCLKTAILTSPCFNGNNFYFTDHKSLDICDRDAVKGFISNNFIDLVINCAAYTDVDGAEKHPIDAFMVNSSAAGHLAHALADTGGMLIHISTDYVYNTYEGWKGTAFKADDALKCVPINMYGLSKRIGELNIKDSGCSHLIIRTSWLHSEYGNNFVTKLYNKILTGNQLRFVCDEIGTPTSAHHLAWFICEFVKKYVEGELYSYYGETINFSDYGCASRYDEALEIARHMDMASCISPCYSNEFTTIAKRPHFSVMDNTLREGFPVDRVQYDWRDGIKLTLSKLFELYKDTEGNPPMGCEK